MDHHENDLRRVRELTRAYGPSLDRWPSEDRRLATVLADDAVATLVSGEQVLDDLIDSCEAPVPSQQLMNSVLTIPTGTESPMPNTFIFGLWPFGAAWQPASVAAVALVAGIAAGQITQLPTGAALGVDEEFTVTMGDLALGEVYFVTGGQQ